MRRDTDQRLTALESVGQHSGPRTIAIVGFCVCGGHSGGVSRDVVTGEQTTIPRDCRASGSCRCEAGQ